MIENQATPITQRPVSFTLTRALDWWRRDQPDQAALVVGDQTVTFAELHAWSGRIAAHLTVLGVEPGDRVAICAQNSMEYSALTLGLLRIGAVGAPVSFRSTANEMRDALAILTPRLFYADADRHVAAAEAVREHGACKLRALEEIGNLDTSLLAPPSHELGEDAPVFIIGTSGSTGRPKGVVYTNRAVMTFACEFAISEPRCGRGSRLLVVGPMSSTAGYLFLLSFLALGVTIYVERQFEPERALDLLVDERITTFPGAPFFFERIAALERFPEADLSGLYWAQVGGARVSSALLQAWHEKGVILRQLYGSTEAGGGWGARDDTALTEPEKCGRGGVFTEYAIAGANGGFASPGEPGEILVRSACLMAGYWNDPAATAAAVPDGWLRSGDLGMIDENGNVTFIDRLKDIIISGGLNISAAEVERIIAEVGGVEEVAVIAAEDPKFGETPLAIIHGSGREVSVAEVLAHCRQHMAAYKVPRYVVVVPEPLPRLPSGKISKPALRASYRGVEGRLEKLR